VGQGGLAPLHLPDSTLHDRLVSVAVAKLKAHKGVAAMAGGRVFTPDDTIDGLPCVVVGKGKEHPGVPGQLRQLNLKVESRAETDEELSPLLVAVQDALNGIRQDGPLSQCVLMDTGPNDGGPGYVCRQDRFGAFGKGE
jgi:hypothetical protein